MKRQIKPYLQFFFILTLFLALLTPKAYAIGAPKLENQVGAALLMDAKSGQVLYAYNAKEILPMASTTKIMTALLVLEQADLAALVTATETAASVEGSKIYLEPGETHTVEDLLYAMLLNSANDVATCLGEYIGGGSAPAFAAMMTQRAQDLGAQDTQFKNPSGLPDEGHYTTAYDLALITRAALQNPEFRQIVTTRTRPWQGINHQGTLLNLNRLLDRYPGVTGVKTGYTVAAQRCLVASAEREGQELISVILRSGNAIWQQSEALLDYGFANFKPHLLVGANEIITNLELSPKRSVELIASRSLQLSLPRGRTLSIEPQIQMDTDLVPPLSAGTVAGYLTYTVDNQPLEPIPLVLAEDVPKEKFLSLAWVTRPTPLVIMLAGLFVFGRLINRQRALRRSRLRRRAYRGPAQRRRPGYARDYYPRRYE